MNENTTLQVRIEPEETLEDFLDYLRSYGPTSPVQEFAMRLAQLAEDILHRFPAHPSMLPGFACFYQGMEYFAEIDPDLPNPFWDGKR